MYCYSGYSGAFLGLFSDFTADYLDGYLWTFWDSTCDNIIGHYLD